MCLSEWLGVELELMIYPFRVRTIQASVKKSI